LTRIFLFSLSLLLFLITPNIVDSAEILNIKSSNSIIIGDQNRNLNVNLVCIKVDEANELEAAELLRKNFPRGTKVKIRPYSKQENILLAKVYNLRNNKEMTELLISADLSREDCLD